MPGAEKAHIVLADHDRLIVTHSKGDDTVYVLRPVLRSDSTSAAT